MKFMILGGGIAGLAVNICLKNICIKSEIFEAAPNISPVGAGITLASNGMKAVLRLGIDEELKKEGRLLSGYTLYNKEGHVLSHTNSNVINGKYREYFAIHRENLHKVLLSFIEPGSLNLNKKAVSIENRGSDIKVKFKDESIQTTEYLICADGINSMVRQKLIPLSVKRYAGYTCWRAVINNSFLNIKELSESWGKEGRFGIVPLSGNQLYWFACINSSPNNQRFKHYTNLNLYEHFKHFHDPIPRIILETPNEALFWDDIFDIAPLKNISFHNILLLGDAAHATTPNLGQGACLALEDAVVIADEIKKTNSVPKAFNNFEKRRLSRVNSILFQSNRVGKIAQLDSGFLIWVRNLLVRILPEKFKERQFKKLYSTDF